MTVKEAMDNYSTDVFQPSKGDNINRVCWQLYQSLDEKLIAILMQINIRYDWDYLKPGAEIKYLPKDVCEQITI
jgi:hypothetical protein